MKKVLLSAALIFGFVNMQAQWTTPRSLIIINNTAVTYQYQIIHHSAFYDGINDGTINGASGPFVMSNLNSLWTNDITGDYTVCDIETLAPGSNRMYSQPTQKGLPVGTYTLLNPNVTSLTDYAQYFRTFYIKGALRDPGIFGPGGAVRYPLPIGLTLTPISGTFGTYAYDPVNLMLFETSASHPTYIYAPPFSSPGTNAAFLIQFTEIGGIEYVLCSS